MRTESNIYQSRLYLFLFLKAFILFGIILYGAVGLGPDEAQYWTWSRQLDWGYYSKPPGIAWQIWLGTQFFGHTEFGIRFMSVIISFFQALCVYYLALECKLRPSTAFWCGIMMAFCPIGLMGSLLAVTDNGLALFWTLACMEVCSALKKERKEPNPYIVGLFILCGALFKWPIYLFWVFYLMFRWRYFSQQPLWKAGAGIFISLLGLLPSLIWNWSHDWATFRHVFSAMQGGHAPVRQGNILEFVGSQFLVLSPILFGLLLAAWWYVSKKRENLSRPLQFCLIVSACSFAILLIASAFQKIQGNWAIVTYPTGIVLIGWFACERHVHLFNWLKGGVAVSVCFVAVFFAAATLYLMPYRYNPLKHNVGWKELQDSLISLGYDPKENYLVSDRYQGTSLLSFYGPEQKRAYFLNLSGARKNQFSYWPQLQTEEKGKTGYFVWVENTPNLEREWKEKMTTYQDKLQDYFEKVDFIGLRPLLYEEDKIAKGFFIFRCENCLDRNGPETEKY